MACRTNTDQLDLFGHPYVPADGQRVAGTLVANPQATMAPAQAFAGAAEGEGFVAGAIVGHDPFDGGAEACVVGDSGLEEGDDAGLALALHDPAEGDAGGIVDVDELLTDATIIVACGVDWRSLSGRELRSCRLAKPSVWKRSTHLRTVPRANAYGFTDGLRRLPTENHGDHVLSTVRRQAGIVMDVHSAPPRIVDVSTTSASSAGAGWTTY